jgi:hypothetical protein
MFKRFLNKMGIVRKGKANVGANSKTKAPAPAPKSKTLLNNKEIGFVVAKMRQATYQGSEFELFYQVISKLQKTLDEKNT